VRVLLHADPGGGRLITVKDGDEKKPLTEYVEETCTGRRSSDELEEKEAVQLV
jgi:hypothetical protein